MVVLKGDLLADAMVLLMEKMRDICLAVLLVCEKVAELENLMVAKLVGLKE